MKTSAPKSVCGRLMQRLRIYESRCMYGFADNRATRWSGKFPVFKGLPADRCTHGAPSFVVIGAHVLPVIHCA